MTKRYPHLILMLAFMTATLLAGCAQGATPAAAIPTSPTDVPTAVATTPPAAAYVVPPPKEEGLASAGGYLFTIYGNAPIPGTVFYLTPAAGEGQDRPPTVLSGSHVEAGDVRGTSGPRGEISLDAIPPGKYFIIVWAPYNWIVAVEPETEDTPRLIEVEAGEELDLGRVDVPWP